MSYLAHADSTLHPLAQWFTIYTCRSIARHMQKGRTVRSSLTLLKQILIHIAFHEAANVFDWQLSLRSARCGVITYLFIKRQNHFPNDPSEISCPNEAGWMCPCMFSVCLWRCDFHVPAEKANMSINITSYWSTQIPKVYITDENLWLNYTNAQDLMLS